MEHKITEPLRTRYADVDWQTMPSYVTSRIREHTKALTLASSWRNTENM